MKSTFFIKVEQFDIKTEIRALVEGQFMAKRIHAENLGYDIGNFIRLFTSIRD